VVKAKSDLIKGDILRLDYGVKFGASTEDELQALGFHTVECNCPLHTLKIITTPWYLPDASKGLKKKGNPMNQEQMDEWKRQSQEVYDSMCSTATDNALAFKRIQPP
jgi:glucuronate isomerase